MDLSHIEASHWYILDIIVSGRPDHSNVVSRYFQIPSHLPVICSLMSIAEKDAFILVYVQAVPPVFTDI